MLTKAEIVAAPKVLDETDIEMWLALIRANSFYRSNVILYPDVETKLADASNTTKGGMLNVILDKIEALGPGEIKITNGDEGLNYSQSSERDAFVRYGLSVLYDAVLFVPQTGNGSYGEAQVRQRNIYCSYCGLLAHPGYICGGQTWP